MEWEHCKENIKPKHEGRNISTITTTPKGTPLIAQIQEQQAKFEQEIKDYKGDDELEVWMRYVNYMEDAYHEGDYLSSVGVIQFRLIKRFQDEEKYKQDRRLLKIFLSLAHRSVHATDVFSYCYHHQLVTGFPTFWLQWLNSYIYLHKYDRAMKVCDKAIQIFESSLFKDLKAQILLLMESAIENKETYVRKTGGELFIDSSQKQLAGPSGRNDNDRNKTQFSIFKDKECTQSSISSISTNILETKHRNKENPQPKRQRWKNVVIDSDSVQPSSKKPFSVFEEGNAVSQSEDHKYEKSSSALKTKKVILSEATSDPALSALKPNSNGISAVSYHKSKVYPMNGEEWSFEEIEAMRRFKARRNNETLDSSSSSKRSRDGSGSSNEDEISEKKQCYSSDIQNDVSLLSSNRPLKSCLSETSKYSNITAFGIENTLMSSTKKISAEKCSDSIMTPNFTDALKRRKDSASISLNLSVRSDENEVSLSSARTDDASDSLLANPKGFSNVETPGDFTLKGLEKSIGLPAGTTNFEVFCDNPNKNVAPNPPKEPEIIRGTFSKKKLLLESPKKLDVNVPSEGSQKSGFEIFSDVNDRSPVKEKTCLFGDSFSVGDVDGRPSDAFNIFKKTPEKSIEESYSLKKVAMTPSYHADNTSEYVPCTVEKMSSHPRGADTQLINREALNILNECSKITEAEETDLDQSKGHISSVVSDENNDSFEPETDIPSKALLANKFEIFADSCSDSAEKLYGNANSDHNVTETFCEGVVEENKQQLTPILEGSRESYCSSVESNLESSDIDHAEEQGTSKGITSNVSFHKNKTLKDRCAEKSIDFNKTRNEETKFIHNFADKTRKSIEATTTVAIANSSDFLEAQAPLLPDKTHRDLHLDTSLLIKVPRTSLLPTEPVSDPFDQNYLEHLIMSLDPPLFYRTNFNQHDVALVPKQNIVLGGVNVTDITKIGEGAFAKVYAGMCVDESEGASEVRAFKIQSPPCPWEFYILTELKQRMMEDDTLREVMDMVLPTHSIHVFKNMSVLVTSLFNEGSLLDMMNHYRSERKSVPAAVIYTYTLDILRCVEAIHRAQIIHGDIKPDNLLLRDKQNTMESMSMKMTKSVVLIDFGRSIDMKLTPKGSLFTVSCKTDLFECVEMQTGRPWTYQIDYYGMLSCIHLMIHNEYMKVMRDSSGRWKPTKKPHRRIDQDLYGKMFDELLNIPDCNSIPPLGPYIEQIEQALKQISTTMRHAELKSHYHFMDKK